MKTQNKPTQFTKWISCAAVAVFFGSIGYLVSSKLGAPSQLDAGPKAGRPDSGDALENGSQAASGARPAAANTSPGGKTGTAAMVSPKAKALLGVKGAPAGTPMLAAGMNPDSDKGRVLKLDSASARKWGALKAGDIVSLPTASGEPIEGTISLVQEDGAWLRLGGFLSDGQGTFSLNTNFNDVSGMVLLPDSGVGYQIQMDGQDVVLVERRMSTLVCYPTSRGVTEMAAADVPARPAGAQVQTVPVINTRPGAKGVIFVDFDGETVTQNVWNGGRTIAAAPSSLTNDQIAQVLNIAAQDWTPFNVTLTTDAALYDATPAGLRMHVVVTPTDTAAPGSGGVAYVNSWSGAGKGFVSGVVCWVFNQSVKTVAEALSHEVGHTVGLSHDGQIGGSQYYSGHGGGLSTPTSWAPIMGSGYGKALVQWSKGEYARANNLEDDIAIIAKAANQFGFVSEPGNGPRALPVTGAAFKTEGLVRGAASLDTYSFTTSGGAFSASAAPAAADSDVDVKLELRDDKDATLAVGDLVAATNASLSRTLPAGSYKLLVTGAGTGPVPAGGYTTGYSAYGSIGKYVLSGSLAGAISLPSFTSPTTVTGSAGTPLRYTVGVSEGSRVVVEKSVLPAGLSFDPATLVLSGTPLKETGPGLPGEADGPGLLSLAATNSFGTVRADFQVQISPAGLPLTEAFLGGAVTSTQASPWVGVSAAKADGTKGTVAQSAAIPNGGRTVVEFSYTNSAKTPAPSSFMTFYWKASTEPTNNASTKGDFVQCLVNGAGVRDADTGRVLVLSGETGWVKQVVRLAGAGPHKVEFAYNKDASLSAGQDRVWVYVASIGQPPVVTSSPASVKVELGGTIKLEAAVSGADKLVWKKDSITVADGTGSGGSQVSGAGTAVLSIVGASATDAGLYWLEARNAFGGVVTRPVAVMVQSPPVIVQQPLAPVGLKVGDTMTLSATVSGAKPLYYQWRKDGVAGRWSLASSSTINLVVPKASATAAGRYSLVLLNQFATVVSDEVVVGFTSAAGANGPSR